MGNFYSKQTAYSILRSLLYFLGWALVIKLIFFLVLWILAKQSWEYIWGHPLLNPLGGLKIWIAIALLYGLIRRNQKPLRFATWGRYLLYIVLFSAFVATLQTYYVHRKNTGWYDMAKDGRCYDKFHSFWLINDKQYFINIDECVKEQMTQKKNLLGKPKYVYTNTGSNNISTYETTFVDYDVITPRLLWIMVAFIIFSIIEMLRRYGAIRLYKRLVSWGVFWREGLLASKPGAIKVMLAGATINLVWLAFMPRIEGYPSHWIPLLLLISAIIFSIRRFRIGKIRSATSTELANWQYMLVGVTISSLLLVILGVSWLYYLLIICVAWYLVSVRKLPAPVAKIILFFLFVFHPDWLFADDGTWSTGGLDALVGGDIAGPSAADNSRDLSDTIGATLPLTLPEPIDSEGPDENEPPEEEFIPPEEVIGQKEDPDQERGDATEGASPKGEHENPADTKNEESSETKGPRYPIDRPLGEDEPGN